MKTGQTFSFTFEITNPGRSLQDADTLPVGYILVNHVDSESEVVIVNTSVGKYTVSGTFPTIAPNDLVQIAIEGVRDSLPFYEIPIFGFADAPVNISQDAVDLIVETVNDSLNLELHNDLQTLATSMDGLTSTVNTDITNFETSVNGSISDLESSVNGTVSALETAVNDDIARLNANVTELTNRIRPQPQPPKIVLGSGYVAPKAGATVSLLNSMYNQMFGGAQFDFPDVYYVALWCAPLDTSSTHFTVGEVAAPSYERVPLENKTSNFTDLIGTEKRNAIDILFPIAEEDWGIVSHVAIMDAAAEGNMLFYSELSTPKEVVSGDQFKFPSSSIRMVLPI